MNSSSHPARHELSIDSAYQWLFTKVNTRWEMDALRQAKTIVAVSEKIRKELVAIGLPPERIQTIVNGVDLQEFAPSGNEDPRRSELGLPNRAPLALFAGDIRTNRKNLDTILHALCRVPELQLAVAGDTVGSPYPSLARRLGVANRTHFLGFRSDMPALMRAADFFVFPSRYEACTLVLIEALASGLPIISASTTGGVEIVGEDAGFVLDDPEDTDSLAHYMQTLTSDLDLRRAMSASARATAEGYSWKIMADRYLGLLEEVVDRPLAT